MKSFFNQAFAFLQKVGRSLMLPVSVLPIAGILLGVGSAHFGLLPDVMSNMMASSGDAVFSSLPLIFAIGVALGFSKNDGVSALAAVLGYMIMLTTMGVMAKILGVETKVMSGVDTINTGVFGGILIGAIAAGLFNRFYRIELPPYLGFFGGKRFVPIITAFAAILTGVVLSVLWPPIGHAISGFSHWAAQENPALAFTIYGIGERSLIPFGLHHIWNVPFFFETGSYTDPVSGKIVTGEIARYLAGDPSAGNLAGGYLFKMWGLPAAALAMWQTAKPENRKRIGGIMISAALTSFVTGITEPIEFSFLFVAPILYAAHALMAGLAFAICVLLGIKHGTTFSHGLIDFVVLFSKSTRAGWLLILGPLYALTYYGVFRAVILRFNLKTPGRENEIAASEIAGTEESLSQAAAIVVALGGGANINGLDSCITRLRVDLVDPSLAQPHRLKELGASGVVAVGTGLQAIFGTKSDNIKTAIEEYLRGQSLRVSTATHFAAVTAPAGAKIPSSADFVGSFRALIAGLGDIGNINVSQPVALSRVRVQVKDTSKIAASELKSNFGESLVVLPGGVIHLLAGSESVGLAAKMNHEMTRR